MKIVYIFKFNDFVSYHRSYMGILCFYVAGKKELTGTQKKKKKKKKKDET